MATADKEIESIRTVMPAFTVSILFVPRTLTVRELDETAQSVGIEMPDVINDFQTHRETQHTHSGHSTYGSAFRIAHEPARYRAWFEDKGHKNKE